MRLEFSTLNGGTVYEWTMADGPSQRNRGVVTGFNDVPSPEQRRDVRSRPSVRVCRSSSARRLRALLRRRRGAQVAQQAMVLHCEGGRLCWRPLFLVALVEKLERVKGIEPSYSAWKAAALPLSYTRAGFCLGKNLRDYNHTSC